MSARGWKRYYLISIQHHSHRIESSRERRWGIRDKCTLCCNCVRGAHIICGSQMLDLLFLDYPASAFVLLWRDFLFDQKHSHVPCHLLYYDPAIFLIVLCQMSSSGSIDVCHWVALCPERKESPLQRILVSLLYSRS